MALRVYTTRLLGRNSELVLHGGGNTSVKTSIKDIDGKKYNVLCVKGSGWDMAEIEPEGLPAVKLYPQRREFWKIIGQTQKLKNILENIIILDTPEIWLFVSIRLDY